MGRNINIYVSDEAVLALEQRKKEPDFNLSGFVSASLIQSKEKASEDVTELGKQIMKIKAEIQLKEADIDLIATKIKRINDQHNLLERQKQEDDEKRAFEEEWHEFWSNITEDLMAEYKAGLKAGLWKNSIDYYKQWRLKHPKEDDKSKI